MIDAKYLSYAQSVLDSKVLVCNYIRLACKRYLDWFNKDDRYFDSAAVDKVVNFIQKLPQSTGKFAGKPLVLQEWQKWVVASIYGFKWCSDGTRVVREVYIEIARKCGKSTLASCLMLYHLVADGENEAQCIFAANSFSQATLAFLMSRNFVESIDKNSKYFKYYRDSIKFSLTKSIMKVVSSDAEKLDGLNCSAFCLDEYHAAKNNNVANVLTSSTGMRTQPIMLYITTAGFDMSNPCYQLRENFIGILEGKLQDDSVFCAIYTLDKEDDIEDPANWVKCQPNLGLTVTESYMKQQLQKAKNTPLLMTNFKTKLLNIWCSNEKGEWIPSIYIQDSMTTIDLQDPKFQGCTGYLGLDLSSTSDITAMTLVIPTDNIIYSKSWYYLPQSALSESSNRDKYKFWQGLGYLNITEGNVVDYNRVIEDIQAINKTIPIECISYDQWQSTMAIIKLTELGFNCQPYSQTTGSMNIPTRHLEMIARNGTLKLDKNLITSWMFGNCEIMEDSNGNIKPVKQNNNSERKIDGVHSTLNALGKYLEQPRYNNEITGFNY